MSEMGIVSELLFLLLFWNQKVRFATLSIILSFQRNM